jgi:hypothetical protein
MSITIKEVLEWTKWRDHGAPYPRLLEKSMRSANSLFADLAISQNEELETLRAQLAEKGAMLGECVEEIKNVEACLPQAHPLSIRCQELLASLPTTTQDVIAKAPWEEAEENRIRHFLSKFPDKDIIDDSPSVIGPPAPMPTTAAVRGVIAKVRKEAFEEAALTVEARGIRIGGAVQPKKAANEIRALKTEVK